MIDYPNDMHPLLPPVAGALFLLIAALVVDIVVWVFGAALRVAAILNRSLLLLRRSRSGGWPISDLSVLSS